jgi:hypothetical protein
MSDCKAGQDPKFRRPWQDQADTRSRVSSETFINLVQTEYFSHAVRVNPQFSNRMIEASRSILNRYIPDIYLYSDVYKGDESGKYVRIPTPAMTMPINTLD